MHLCASRTLPGACRKVQHTRPRPITRVNALAADNTRRATELSRLISAAQNAEAGCSRSIAAHARSYHGHDIGELVRGKQRQKVAVRLCTRPWVTSCQRDIDLSKGDEQHEKVSATGRSGHIVLEDRASDLLVCSHKVSSLLWIPADGDAVFHHEHH